MQEIMRTIAAFSDKVADILKEHLEDGLISVCLFGSAARGTLRRGSDIDFLVIKRDSKQTYHKRVKEIVPLLDNIRETVEYQKVEGLNLDLEPCFLILTMEEIADHPPILIDISQEGKILFDREGFLNTHVSEVQRILTKLGATKKMTPQGHYWVLKPDLRIGEVIEI